MLLFLPGVVPQQPARSYVAIALNGQGEIVIGDNPTIDTNFSKLLEVTHLDKFTAYYQELYGLNCSVLDLREVWCDDLRNYGKKSLMAKLPGDPRGDSVVNLGEKSFFYGLNPLLYRACLQLVGKRSSIIMARRKNTPSLNSIFHSDVYISIPS